MPKLVAEMKDKAVRSEVAKARGKKLSRNIRVAVGGNPPGLAVQVTPTGSTSWIYRTVYAGRRREIGLGAYLTTDSEGRERVVTSLGAARRKAADAAKAIRDGGDPIAAIQTAREHKTTFKEVATEYIAASRSAWKRGADGKPGKHEKQWTTTLEKWAYPHIGDKPIEWIDKRAIYGLIMQPVPTAGGTPFWVAHRETARKVRERVEAILDHATAHDYRVGENPARWRGVIQPMLTKQLRKPQKVQPHASLPYADVAAFIASLRGRSGAAARALEFAILTAARSGEVRAMSWDEDTIDFDNALWIVPEKRMKAGIEHEVPLSDMALAILAAIPKAQRKGLVFPGTKAGQPLSDMTLAKVIKLMHAVELKEGRKGYVDPKRKGDDGKPLVATPHGFRATFRTWASENMTNMEERTIENALAHSLPNEVQWSYERTTQLPKRKKLMQQWADYLSPKSGSNVVHFGGRG